MVRNAAIKILTPVLLILCPYVYYIEFNRYGFLNVEALLLLVMCLLSGLFLGTLLLHKNWYLRLFILTITITVSFSFFSLFKSIVATQIVFFIVLLLNLFLMDYVLPIIPIVSVAFLFAIFFLPMQHELTAPQYRHTQVSINQQLPPVIDIILDEHVGINGIPTNLPGGKKLQKQLIQFYQANGFTLYPNAFSHYARTFNSIPNLLNIYPNAENTAYFPKGIEHLNLTQNQIFTLLSQAGYAIDVFQPNYINFCKAKKAKIENCYTYPVFSLPYEKRLDIPRKSHLIYLTKSFLHQSSIFESMIDVYEFSVRPALAFFHINVPHLPFTTTQIAPLAVPDTFNALSKAIIAHPNGRVFFVHVMMPHYSYIFDQYCHANPDVNAWLENHDLGPKGNMPARRKLRYGLYENQLRCNYRLLGNFFDKLKQAGIYDKAIIIVNGDHSSRIMQVAPIQKNADAVTWQDFEDSYATLYAVKWPGQKGNIDASRASITYLYGKAIEQIIHKPIHLDNGVPYVFLTVENTDKHIVMQSFPLTHFKHAPKVVG